MQETNTPAGGSSRENNIESHRGRNFTIPQPIAEEEQQQPQVESSETGTGNKESTAASFIDSIKKFFAPCVGAVDAASLYIGECRPSKYDSYDINEQGENVAEDVIMRLRERNGGFRQQNVKRRSETLEIPTHGMLFDDDDVSAISSHTLEEMERLRMAQNSRLSNFHMSPSNNYDNFESSAKSNIMRPLPSDKLQKMGAKYDTKPTWNIQRPPLTHEIVQATNERDLSICVSASDSSSSEGIEQRKQDTAHAFSAPPSWDSKAEKDQGFETHRVG